jgi:hypothetical protein
VGIYIVLLNAQGCTIQMKFVSSIILFGLLPLSLLSQHLTDSLLTSFYNTTLIYYFSDTTTNKDQEKFGYIFVETSHDTSKLVKSAGTNRFRFLDKKINIQQLLDTPLVNNGGRVVYRINHTAIAKDTIDITINAFTITVNQNKVSLKQLKHGTFAYVPDGRFIHNRESDRWDFISGEEISYQLINKGK